jgi:hypothetical protein
MFYELLRRICIQHLLNVGGEEIRKKGGGVEFKYDIFDIL